MSVLSAPAEARILARTLNLPENDLLRKVLLHNRHIMMDRDGKHRDSTFIWVRPKWDEATYTANLNALYASPLVSETRRAQERKDVILIIVEAPVERLKSALRLLRHKVDLSDPSPRTERVDTSISPNRLLKHPRPTRMLTA